MPCGRRAPSPAVESRFALLSPKAQRALIARHEQAYMKLRQAEPLLNTREEKPAHSAIVAAKLKEAEAGRSSAVSPQSASSAFARACYRLGLVLESFLFDEPALLAEVERRIRAQASRLRKAFALF